jgi:hypothetical protein
MKVPGFQQATFESIPELLAKHREAFSADPEFDTYEKVDDNYAWRAVHTGIRRAIEDLRALSAASPNEFVLIHTSSGTVIARLNCLTH